MNQSELADIDHLVQVVMHITQSLPYGNTVGVEHRRNITQLLEIQQKLLKKLDELVSKAGS